MDKILFRGEVRPNKFARIGMGVKVAENVREEVEKEIDGGWVTDHYGVMGNFELQSEWRLQSLSSGGGQEMKSKLS
jgi:tyrosyl-DNA phosphodiesterase 2